MVKATLLLHFYRGQEFLGQKLLWVEVTSTRALAVLISRLAQARQPEDLRHGTEEFPTVSEGFRRIKADLEQAFDRHDDDPNWKEADSVRVMQVSEGWPFEVPRALSM